MITTMQVPTFVRGGQINTDNVPHTRKKVSRQCLTTKELNSCFKTQIVAWQINKLKTREEENKMKTANTLPSQRKKKDYTQFTCIHVHYQDVFDFFPSLYLILFFRYLMLMGFSQNASQRHTQPSFCLAHHPLPSLSQ